MVRTFHTFDVIIIGGGSAGMAALKETLRHTQNVVLINDGPVTTTCARVGCMPSKVLIHSAKRYDSRHDFADAGISGGDQLAVDIPAVMNRVRQYRDFFVSSLQEEISRYAGYIIDARAMFESRSAVRAAGKLYHGKSIIVTVGSSPVVPKEWKPVESFVMTSDSLFELRDLPKRIAVVGLGPMGIELGQAFAMLGCEVTGIQKDDHVGALTDPDLNRIMLAKLERQMTVWLDAEPVYENRGGAVVVRNGEREAEVDAIFAAVGRQPNLASIGLDKLGLPLRDNGMPDWDRETMRVGDSDIFIAGDASDRQSVLHEAVAEGKRAAFFACGGGDRVKPLYVPLHIVFTEPNIATVGKTGREALGDPDLLHGDASFRTQGRARIEQENEGTIRVFVERSTGRLSGAEILSSDGEHHAHLLALAIQQKLTLSQILETPIYHPTTEEGVRTAIRDAQSKLETQLALI